MQHRHVLPLLLALLSFTADAAGGQAYARKRDVSTASSVQDAQTTTQTSVSIPSSTASSSDADSPTSSSTTSMIDIHTDISNPQPTITSSPPKTANGTLNANALPIQPTITPAIGVTGVVLIITGVAYGLIGIKNQWLHVFFSTAFLTSLSVTVLIEYVMTPPVSNAVQGAYFVAAFFTGVIFGALSLIFKELTEGLGCLLGGFCLSMWLLSLKRGGLLSSSDTRGAFMGAFCVAFYALSFSSYTRPYGLIASTAFAGSTAAVIGIDCFSRAGWKEFWLYIWGLNDNLFPLGTSTYPVTRGIRVELAVTLVICLLGLLSQLRLWKLIRERRKKQEEVLAEEKRKKDEAEMELGRAIEEKKANDLARWEAIYGDSPKSNDTTVVQTPVSETHRTPSMTKEEMEVPDNSVEMTVLSPSTHETTVDNDIVEDKPQPEDDIHDTEKDALAEEESPQGANPTPESEVDEKLSTTNDESKQTENKDSGPSSQTPSPPPPPPPSVTPLPFKVPEPENKPGNGDDDGHSVQAIIDDADTASVRTSKRFSAASLFRRLSRRNSLNRRSRLVQSESDEMLVAASAVSDASSNQGIVDSETGSMLEERESINMDTHMRDVEPTPDEDYETAVQEAVPDTTEVDTANAADLHAGESDNKTQIIPPIEENKAPTEVEAVEEGLGIVSENRRHTIDGSTFASPIKALPLAPVTRSPSKTADMISEKEENVEKSEAALSTSKSKSSPREQESLTSEVVKTLPSHVSPVVMSYRTNEWAKHLAHADAPEPEPLEEPRANTEDSTLPEDMEVAAPLNIEELKQTALTATPPPAIEKRSSLSESVTHVTIQRSTSNISKNSVRGTNSRQLVGDQSPDNATSPPLDPVSEVVTPTSPMHHAPGSSPSSRAITPGGLRSVSTPLLSTTLAAPSTQKIDARHSLGQVIEEESYSLMAQRERMIQARHSSVSLTREAWAPRNTSRQSIAEEGYPSRPGSQLSLIEDDDMPLTQRRALLQQRPTSPPPLLGMDPETRRPLPIDRLPSTARLSRESSKQKVTTMAAWRESLQEDFSKHRPLLEVDMAQNELMEQQRRAQVANSRRIMASENLHNSIAERMRHGDMQDLHREAMRRMQAAANRRTNE